jgi:hypothetical protein
VVHELHEGRADDLAESGSRQDEVVHGHDGHDEDERDDDEDLSHEAAFPPAWDPFVPDGREELLTVRVGDELERETRSYDLKWGGGFIYECMYQMETSRCWQCGWATN